MSKRSLRCLALLAGVSLAGWFAVSPAPAEEKASGEVEVKFDLPKPVFVGTPKKIPPGTTVQKPTGKPRTPLTAPEGAKNVALEKKVTSSDSDPVVGKVDLVTDGMKEGTEGNFVELGPGLQWIQVDLEKPQTIYGILMWHRHDDPRVYRDVVVQISDDPEFKRDVTTVFNNDQDNSAKLGEGKDYEYFEAAEGKLIDCKLTKPGGVKGRYVRCWSKGSTADDQNHYTEIEVYAVPGK